MFDQWRRAVEETPEPNLIPVMNLMMTLIPLLLLGASFFHMAVIPTSTSQLSPSDTDVPKTPTQVSVNLMIDPEGFRLTAASTSLDPDTLDAMKATLPKRGGSYDLDALQRYLWEIKSRYPASNTLLLFPYDGLGYQTLVAVLDHTRERRRELPGRTEPLREPLFPVTVFNRLLPEPEPELEPGAEPTDEAGSEPAPAPGTSDAATATAPTGPPPSGGDGGAP